ncbi:hypothetical protein HanXRQr2_Chr03g0086541 [Helianthus annuus]|uniref:Uncharacterized protein n=1 Tax=Helianthus annuus TaxID=4232 RepID=A0A9K3NUG6_HELAN|nr:hypothetical protein HanXRQr2_Chr03g0086541 [Helianthus annuus]KAJ0495592.1 hypothetical protein HanIR_Chr12g0610641 [Helianthus annuus]
MDDAHFYSYITFHHSLHFNLTLNFNKENPHISLSIYGYTHTHIQTHISSTI